MAAFDQRRVVARGRKHAFGGSPRTEAPCEYMSAGSRGKRALMYSQGARVEARMTTMRNAVSPTRVPLWQNGPLAIRFTVARFALGPGGR